MPTRQNNASSSVVSCRCGEPGHRRNNRAVKDNVKCSSCSKAGHLEKACKSKVKTKIENMLKVKLDNELRTKQKFCKKVVLNSSECEAFFFILAVIVR